MKRVTVKDLKNWIKDWPDDAYVYEAQYKGSTHIIAIDSYTKDLGDGYVEYSEYHLPKLPYVPLTSENVLDYINKNYE